MHRSFTILFVLSVISARATVAPTADQWKTDLVQSLAKPPGSLEGDFSGQLAVPNQQLDLTFRIAKDAVSVSIPKLQIATLPVANFKRDGTTVKGNFAIGNQNVALRGRFTGRYFLGWLELSGRPYSFCLLYTSPSPRDS